MNIPICYIFTFFLIFLPLIKTQQEPKLNVMYLNKNYSNKLDQNESHEYYILTLDNFTQNPDDKIPKMLTFYIQENKSNIEDGEEIFSDPDVYVSKINKYPSNPGNSEWYSERYGNDILTISDIKVNDTFYVGIYCQFKCRYTIFPSLIWDFF